MVMYENPSLALATKKGFTTKPGADLSHTDITHKAKPRAPMRPRSKSCYDLCARQPICQRNHVPMKCGSSGLLINVAHNVPTRAETVCSSQKQETYRLASSKVKQVQITQNYGQPFLRAAQQSDVLLLILFFVSSSIFFLKRVNVSSASVSSFP